MVYPIQLPDGSYKFNNSDLIARYIHAANLLDADDYASRILDQIFTGSNSDGISFQSVLQNSSADEAEKLLQSWLKDFGAKANLIKQISEATHSERVDEIMNEIKNMGEDRIHAKGIPTLIYDGKKHNGLYK